MKFSRDQKLFIVELVNTIDKIHLAITDFQMAARLSEDKKDIILEAEAAFANSKYTDHIEICDHIEETLAGLKSELKTIHKKALSIRE